MPFLKLIPLTRGGGGTIIAWIVCMARVDPLGVNIHRRYFLTFPIYVQTSLKAHNKETY